MNFYLDTARKSFMYSKFGVSFPLLAMTDYFVYEKYRLLCKTLFKVVNNITAVTSGPNLASENGDVASEKMISCMKGKSKSPK